MKLGDIDKDVLVNRLRQRARFAAQREVKVGEERAKSLYLIQSFMLVALADAIEAADKPDLKLIDGGKE